MVSSIKKSENKGQRMQKTTITTPLLGFQKRESNLYLQKDGLMTRRANLHQRLDEPTQNPTQIGGICAYKWFVFSLTFVFLKVNTPQKHLFLPKFANCKGMIFITRSISIRCNFAFCNLLQ